MSNKWLLGGSCEKQEVAHNPVAQLKPGATLGAYRHLRGYLIGVVTFDLVHLFNILQQQQWHLR